MVRCFFGFVFLNTRKASYLWGIWCFMMVMHLQWSFILSVNSHRQTQCDSITRNSSGMTAVPVTINTKLFWGHWQHTPPRLTLNLSLYVYRSLSLTLSVYPYHISGVRLCGKKRKSLNQRMVSERWAVCFLWSANLAPRLAAAFCGSECTRVNVCGLEKNRIA